MQYRHRATTFLAICAVMALVTGCEREGLVDGDQSGTAFEQIQAQIFNLSCAVSGCHLGSGAPLGLDLSSGRSYGNLVGVASALNANLQRVEPGNPDNSFLVVKLEGGPADKLAGARMPFQQPPLSAAQIQMIRDWISAGALQE